MVSAPKPPKPPDPGETAAAQTGQNVATAIANQRMAMVDQYTPYGDLVYNQFGTYTMTDPNSGETYEIPLMRANTTLSPHQQGLLEKNQQFENLASDIGLEQTRMVGNLLSNPVDLGDTSIDKHLAGLWGPMYNEKWGRADEMLRNRLANQGIQAGTDAYRAEMQGFNDAKDRDWRNMMLGGRGQAIQQMLAERSTPLNEVIALLRGQQIRDPNFINTPVVQQPTTDFAGITQRAYDQQLAGWQAQQAQNSAMLGGLASLGATLGGWAFSDRRLKKDIKPVGKLDDGTTLYRYKLKGGGLTQLGVMAQEIEHTHPEAVAEVDGVKMVDYSALVEGL